MPAKAVARLKGAGTQRAPEVSAGERGDGSTGRRVERRGGNLDAPGTDPAAPGDLEDGRGERFGWLEGWADADLAGRNIHDNLAEGDPAGPAGEDRPEVIEAGSIDGRIALEEGSLPFDDQPERFTGEAGKGSGREDCADRGALDGAGLERTPLDEVEGFAGAGRKAKEGVVDGRVEGVQQGEELGPDAVTQEGKVAVGGIGPGLKVERGADGEGIGTPEREEGSQEDLPRTAGKWARRQHSAEAAHPRPAQEVEQHGFGLVVGRVAGDNGVAAFLLGGEGEELVAHRPGGLLDAAALAFGNLAHGAFAGNGFEAKRCGVLADELAVGGGPGTELVVEVRDLQLEPETVAKGEEQVKAGEGIGAP